MRKISIDLGKIEPIYKAGKMFEANASEIELKLSNDFITDADFYIIDFEDNVGKCFNSEHLQHEDNKIKYCLNQGCTKSPYLNASLAAYKEEANKDNILIQRSNIFKLTFDKSIQSDIQINPEVSGYIAEIIELIKNGKIKGEPGFTPKKGIDYTDGKSAYQIALDNGFEGTQEDWLESLKGQQGEKGEQGIKGEKGDAFKYDDFTPEQLAALKGDKGDKGDTGAQGEQGIQGIQGEKGDKGDDYILTDEDKKFIAKIVSEKSEMLENKTSDISSESTDEQYPSAKAVFEYCNTIKKEKYTLIVDSTVTEESQLLENKFPYIQFESDTQGNPFSYNKLLIEVKFPSVITSQIYPYFRVNSNGHFNSNTFGYGVKNIDRINGIIEKLPNGHIACEFTFQNGAYFGVNKIGNINTEKYSIIQENFTGIRFMFRQEDMIIPVGTTMKVWGVE